MRGPEAAELCEPLVDLLERLGTQAIESALRVNRGLDEAGVAKNAQVLGDHWLRHAQLTLDLAHRLFRCHQQTQDGAPVGLGNDFKGGSHITYILLLLYTCQGILAGSERMVG